MTFKEFIESLCSERCAGRAPGSSGGLAARALVVEAFRQAGLEPVEQPVPGRSGANARPEPSVRLLLGRCDLYAT